MNPYASPTLNETKTGSRTRRLAPLLGVVGGIVFTPFALWLAMISAGAGHGSYGVAKILFPIQMLSTLMTDSISIPVLITAAVQYPIVGAVAGTLYRIGTRQGMLGSAVLAGIHCIFVLVVFRFGSTSF